MCADSDDSDDDSDDDEEVDQHYTDCSDYESENEDIDETCCPAITVPMSPSEQADTHEGTSISPACTEKSIQRNEHNHTLQVWTTICVTYHAIIVARR